MFAQTGSYCNARIFRQNSPMPCPLDGKDFAADKPMDTQTQPKLSRSHPLAGTKLTGADIIIQVLADEGVTTIFGYSGGAILPTYDAVFRYNKAHSRDGAEPMPLIVPANEQGAGFM